MSPNDPALEEPDCPMCGATPHPARKPAYTWPEEPYAVQHCQPCGFYFLSPRPTEEAILALYRRDDYYAGDPEGGYDDYAAQEDALRRTFRRLLKTMTRRGITGRRLLEVGCGYGYLLSEAAPYFSERTGTDFSPAAIEQARQHAGRVVLGGPDALDPEERFDVIVTNHVIEHVYHPHEFVKNLLGRLEPGGHLVISTPDMGAFWRPLMGRRWPSFKRPEHVLYFDRAHLQSCLADAGFQVKTTIPYPHAFPLPLAAAKLGLRLPRILDRYSLWIPKTTLAMWAVRPAEV